MKAVIVTGGTRGLGLSIVKTLIRDYFVVAISRKLSDELDELMKGDGQGKILFVPYDLSELDGIRDLVKSITQQTGPLYGLVNNAAVGYDGVLATMHDSQIDRMLRLNLQSPIILTKYVCRTMLSQGYGRIVNISSIIATTGFNGLSVYGASKAGLGGFTRSLARELGRVDITVNTVAPGYIETEMTAGLSSEKLDTIRRRTPSGKLATVGDVAAAVRYLMSDDAASITGTVLTVDAGSTA